MAGNRNSGGKRKPTNLHILNGNPSKRDMETRQKSEPQFTQVAPDCPQWLDQYAKEEWERLFPELERLGLLTQADLAAFAGYCESFSDFRRSSEELQALGPGGWIQTTETGYKQQHPLVGIKNTAKDKMKAFLIEFGFTPASRSKVGASNATSKTPGKKVGGLMSR